MMRRTGTDERRGVGRPVAVAVAAVLATAACSPDDHAAPGQPTAAPEPPAPAPDEPVGSPGTDVEFGALSLLDVHLVPPRGDRYHAGDDARVRLTLVNRGREADALTGLASPAATGAAVHWDRGCDGVAEEAGRLPVTAGGGVPTPPGASGNRHGPYYAELTGLHHEILAGTTVPISFTFEKAGTVSVAAKVRSRLPGEAQPAPLACLTPETHG